MNQFNNLSCEVLRIAESMKLTFGSTDVMQQQFHEIEQQQARLIRIKTILEPYIEKLQTEIVRIDEIRIAKAAVGIALLIIGNSNDNNEDNLISSICSEITLDIGHELLGQAIHDESGLRELHNNLINLKQNIETKIKQGEQLKELAEECFTNPLLIRLLEQPLKSITLSELAEQFSDLAIRVKLIFTFGNPQLMGQQIQSTNIAIQKLWQMKLKLDKFIQCLEHNTSFCLTPILMEALLSLFGPSIARLEYDSQGQFIFTIANESQNLQYICKNCTNLWQKLNNLIPLAEQLKNLAEECIQNQAIIQLLEETSQSKSLNKLENCTGQLVESMSFKFTFGDMSFMQQQLIQIKQFQSQLKPIQKKLDLVTQDFDNNPVFPLNCGAITALLSLLGTCLVGVGFDKNGVLVFYQSNGIETVESVLQSSVQMKQMIKQPIIQSIYLMKLATQCIQSPKLIQQLEEAKPPISLADLKQEVKSLAKRVNRELTFGNLLQMHQQVKDIKDAVNSLKKIKLKLEKITHIIDQDTGLSLNPFTIGALISLLGLVSSVEFDDKGKLVINQNNKQEKATDIIHFSISIKEKIEKHINKSSQLIELAEQCFKDSTLRERLNKKQKLNKLKMKAVLVASTLLLLSPVGWTTWNRFGQEQTRTKAQALVAEAANIDNASSINVLKTSQQQLKDAIALLEAIPDAPGSAYQKAQTDLISFRSRLDTVEQRLKTEEQATANLEAAQKLAMEAATLVQNPPHPAEVWKQAQAKWQEAINLLAVIPESAFVSTQAKEKLPGYRANYDAITQRFTDQEKASVNLDTAQKLGWEATKMIQNPPHPLVVWQQAQAKSQEAIQLLEGISNSTSVFLQAQEKLVAYRTNYMAINQRLDIEKKAAANLNAAENLVKQAVEITNNPPYKIEVLKKAQANFEQANNFLKSIPSGTTVSTKAASLKQKYSRDYSEISERIKEIESCVSQQLTYCIEAEISLPVQSSESLP
ncbi:MAG: hypothetical protein AB1589_12965 [Cyanobacteriota bacterium]